MPIVEEMMDQLKEGLVYYMIDLKNGFQHVKMPSIRKNTVFVTKYGQLKFIKVPFGLSNVPAVYQIYQICILKIDKERNYHSIYTTE